MASMEPEKYSPELRTDLMEQETSVRAAIAVPGGGAVVTMGFPGLAFGIDGAQYLDPERMAATLAHPALEGCRLLALLVEPEEAPEGAVAQLSRACQARGMRLVQLPIEDYAAPSADFAAAWAALAPEIAAALAPGAALGLACHYGAGRSGMIAAGVLIDRGMPAEEAVATLRAQFPDSVESAVQRDWLIARGRGAEAAR